MDDEGRSGSSRHDLAGEDMIMRRTSDCVHGWNVDIVDLVVLETGGVG